MQIQRTTRLLTACLTPLLACTFLSKLEAASVKQTSTSPSVNVLWNTNPEPDIARYTVHYGESSGQYSSSLDAGKTTSLAVNGLTPGKTYYFAVKAHNTAGLDSGYSQEVAFTLAAPAGGMIYNSWASAAGLSGANASAQATPHNDGVPNLVKYAFNMDASGADSGMLEKGMGTAGLPVFNYGESATKGWIEVEYLRRKGDAALVYTPKTSQDLRDFQTMTGTTTVQPVDTQWERVITRMDFPLGSVPKMFGKVEVTSNAF